MTPGELIHMDFFYVLYTHYLSLIINYIYTKFHALWIFLTAYKFPPTFITQFTLKIIERGKMICKYIRSYEDGAFNNSSDVNNSMVYNFIYT